MRTSGGGVGVHVESVAEPGSGRGRWLTLLGASGAAGVDVRQLSEPLDLQEIQQPPQLQQPFDLYGGGKPVEVLGLQVIHGRGQRR